MEQILKYDGTAADGAANAANLRRVLFASIYMRLALARTYPTLMKCRMTGFVLAAAPNLLFTFQEVLDITSMELCKPTYARSAASDSLID